MPFNTLLTFLRRHWFLVTLVILAVSLASYVIYHSKEDPLELLSNYGYIVLVIWTLLEGETIVVVAGIFSEAAGLHPPLIVLCAFCGTFCSDQLMFSLGKYKGDAMLRKFPKLNKNLDRATRLFKKYDTALILGFRFVYGIRNVTPILLGLSGISHKKFFFLNFIGAMAWATIFTYGGVYLGQAFMSAMRHFGHGALFAVLALLIVAGFIWYFKVLKPKRARRAALQALRAARALKMEEAHPE